MKFSNIQQVSYLSTLFSFLNMSLHWCDLWAYLWSLYLYFLFSPTREVSKWRREETSILRPSSMKKLSSFIPWLSTISKWLMCIVTEFLFSLKSINKNRKLPQNDWPIWHCRSFTHWICFLLSARATTSFMETGPSATSEVKNTCKYLFYCTSPSFWWMIHIFLLALLKRV